MSPRGPYVTCKNLFHWESRSQHMFTVYLNITVTVNSRLENTRLWWTRGCTLFSDYCVVWIDFNHTPEIGRARGLPLTIIQRAQPMQYLCSQPSVCFDTSAFWWIGLRLWTYKAVGNFKRDLGPSMQIRLIKPLFVREKCIRVLRTLVKKRFPRSRMQYGFSISKRCCHLPDNADLLSAVDCLLNV